MSNLSICSTSIRQIDGLYSLNDLHKASGGEAKYQPARFTRLSQTQELINEINHYPDMGSATKSNTYTHNADIDGVIKVVNGGEGRGTFVCKELVYAYAMWVSAAFMLTVIRSFDNLMQNQPDPATSLFLNTSHARTQARKAGLNFYEARQAILKQINTPAALALGLPPATEQIAEGVIADMFVCGRFVVGFDINQRLQINQLHPNDIVINPNNLVSTILHGVIKPHDFPSILGAIANVLERKTHHHITK